MMNCVRKRKNTHYPFTTENAANDGPVIFSSLFTTKALSPHHMAHAIKCVCKPQVERKLLTRKKSIFTPRTVTLRHTERPKRETKTQKVKGKKEISLQLRIKSCFCSSLKASGYSQLSAST